MDPRRPRHGPEWEHVFNVGADDSELIWRAIAAVVLDAPVSTVRDRAPHGVVCGVEVELTINDRMAQVGRRPGPRGTTSTRRPRRGSSPPTRALT